MGVAVFSGRKGKFALWLLGDVRLHIALQATDNAREHFDGLVDLIKGDEDGFWVHRRFI